VQELESWCARSGLFLSTDQASGAMPSMTCLEVLKSEYSSVHDLCVVCDAVLFALPSVTIFVRSLNGFPLGRTDWDYDFTGDPDDWVIDLMMDAQHLSSLLATVLIERVRTHKFEAEDAWYRLIAKPRDVLAPLHGFLSNVPVLGLSNGTITPHQVRGFAEFFSNAEVMRLQRDKWFNCMDTDTHFFDRLQITERCRFGTRHGVGKKILLRSALPSGELNRGRALCA